MKLIFQMILTLCVCSISLAADTQVELTPAERFESQSDRRISQHPDIFSGPYLIYDCVNKRYVCVDEFSHERCILSRETSLQGNSHLLSCAPLKLFDTYYKCTKANLSALEDARPVRFCFKE